MGGMGKGFGISWSPPGGRVTRLTAALGAMALLAGITGVTGVTSGSGRRERNGQTLPVSASVVIRAASGMTAAVERAVTAAGGTVRQPLPVIGGFTADVPGAALDRVAAIPGVEAVTPDGQIQLLGASVGAPGDAGTPMSTATAATGARALWSRGITGSGVDVAVIDSGVSAVPGLGDPGKLVVGPDFSRDADGPKVGLDRFGHGTHMAGIIAGRDPGIPPSAYADDQQDYLGMAPDARIVSVKVADENGSTDLTRLLAAIDWVVAHKDDAGLHIRVLNLSFGVAPSGPYLMDPLAYAAEQAWNAGIVVVAAAGNLGDAKATGGSLTDPAYDPFVIAVGAADIRGTVARSDDVVADFSNTAGQGDRRPDVVAPGRLVQGLLAPDSRIAGQTPGAKTRRFIRGSGTSQATAMVSGAAALLVSQRPGATPDQIKALLTRTATAIGGTAAGAGEMELSASIRMATPSASQLWTPATGPGPGGLGTDPATGSPVATGDSTFGTGSGPRKGPVKGENDATKSEGTGEPLGHSWSGHSWSGHSWSGHSWSGEEWAASQ